MAVETVAVRVARVNRAPASAVNVVSMASAVNVANIVVRVKVVVNGVVMTVPACGAKAVLPVRRGPTCRRRCGR